MNSIHSPHTRPQLARPAAAAVLAFTVWAAASAAALLVPMQTAKAQVAAAPASATQGCPVLLRQTLPRLQDEAPQSLCQYSGRVLLVVNTASFCGYTPQYEGLEALHAKYNKQGLVVLGFPSNDFEQETGSNKEIADFCSNTYGVKFPMFTKTTVVGKQAHPLYQQLAKATGQAPNWNFGKYLIDRHGKPVAFYDSKVAPDDPKLLADVQKALAAR